MDRQFFLGWLPSGCSVYETIACGSEGLRLETGPEVEKSPILRHQWYARLTSAKELFLVAATAGLTTIVVPFVQALMSKAAEDAYTRLQRLFRRLPILRTREPRQRP
jgi:hypothetical protein